MLSWTLRYNSETFKGGIRIKYSDYSHQLSVSMKISTTKRINN